MYLNVEPAFTVCLLMLDLLLIGLYWAEFIPLHKNGDESSLYNYIVQYIVFLPIYHKILEKLLHERLSIFLNA
jgi:hypothetical protein